MNEMFAELVAMGRGWLVLAGIVFLRVGAAMALLPAFGERSIPERIRLVLALAFTAIVFPAVATSLQTRLDAGTLPGFFLITEAVAGLAIGIVIRLFVLALQIAGSIAAQSTSLAQIFGGDTVEPQPAIGHVLLVAGLALAVMLGLHVRLAQVLILSYDILPAGQMPGGDLLSQWGVARIAKAFGLAFTLAAPFVIASLIYNVALGVINRAMPQLMVAFVGAPAITAAGLILLFLTAPVLLSTWIRALDLFLNAPFGAW
ncbi:flagellar biosynthetic protein FliR [Aliiroseovarius sp.]|uniref:flagellar biosynthetic protein FliR n=1 Tax=Aliiroseovarius sp. TaxID=1872442 RepID=UPI00262E5843|nr:flagellar biosynthetic protein FliR [Aliiroseovarius sp.]